MSYPLPVTSKTTRPLVEGAAPLDLAAIGESWKPPQVVDTTPEVSDILNEMPWWAARGLIYLIVAFLLFAFVWSAYSQVDVIVESRGALAPEGYVRPVQPATGGVVQQIFVREGDRVESGQPLLQVDPAEIRTRLGKLREELSTSQEQLRRLQALKGPVAETLDQENRIVRLQSEVAAAELTLRSTILTAPVKGVLTTWDVRGAGAVLQVGQTIATIAPEGARLLAEVRVSNKDIALLEPGLPVKIKLDAFPYQDYGLMQGTLVEIAPDAEGKDAGLSYKVKIAPAQSSISAKGRAIPLRSGLALTAEVITERKSVLSLILEPFRKLRGGNGSSK